MKAICSFSEVSKLNFLAGSWVLALSGTILTNSPFATDSLIKSKPPMNFPLTNNWG